PRSPRPIARKCEYTSAISSHRVPNASRFRLSGDCLLPSRVPLHISALAVRVDCQPHGHDAVITGHHVALQSIAVADGVLQIAVMQQYVFAAGLLVNDLRLIMLLVEASLRADDEAIAGEFQRRFMAA